MILVLIDFDGVIVDTKKNSFDIFKKSLEKLQNCKNFKLIKNLYNQADGLNLLSISKLLGNFYKTDYLKFYKFFSYEWSKAYKEISLRKEILEFFDFINNLDVKIVIFSSSNIKDINRILKTKLKKYDFIQKQFDNKYLLSNKTIHKIKYYQKITENFVNIDDNAFINRQMSKINFIPIHYEVNNTKKNLTETFIQALFKSKINFFYNIDKSKRINFNSLNYDVSKDIIGFSSKKSKKITKKSYFNNELSFLHSINFKNKKLNINGFQNYYNLRFLKKHISFAVQGYIVINFNNYIIGKRKKVITEKKLYEFIPSGGLINFSKNDLYLQIKNECMEELDLDISKKEISIIGFYLDFSQNLLDFIFKIDLKNSSILKYKLAISSEHSNFLIKKKKYLKKNINQFTNTSKKIITRIIDEQ